VIGVPHVIWNTQSFFLSWCAAWVKGFQIVDHVEGFLSGV